MTYQDFLTAYRGAGATAANADAAGRALGLKRARNWTQSTWVQKVAEEAMRLETADRQRAERAAVEAARKAKLAAEAARRGTLDSFVERARDMSEDDRALGWKLRYFQRDEQAWDEVKAKFVENLDKHPTYALSWSGDMFAAAAALEVAREVRAMFEAGVDAVDMTDYCLREAMRGARNLGNSRSTSNTSNLVDDTKTRAWATAYERLTGR